jgi:4'-phosphopantetheinyl transferase
LVHVDAAEELGAELSSALSPDERERADRARTLRDRRRRVLRRSCLRVILSGYLGRPPATLRFRPEPGGRPVLDPPNTLTFSSAHGGAVSLVAVGRGRALGIDVEPLSAATRIAAIADEYLPRDRVRRIRTAAPERREEEWVGLWTELEACAKLNGSGLGDLDAARAETLLDQGDHRVHFRPEAGYLATLVYRGRTAPLSCFVFDPRARLRASSPAIA